MDPYVSPWVAAVFFTLLGLVFGSFGNVLIHRLPKGDTILGRSKCPKCKRILRAIELIPVVSYTWLRGKCRGCKTSIPLRYPLVELATAVLFLAALDLSGNDLLGGFLLAVALWLLLLIAVTDARTGLIPDWLTLGLGGVSILYGFFAVGSIDVRAPALGFAFFGAQWLLSRGRWIGSGDVFLALSIGLLLGDWRLMLLSLMLAYIFGAIVAAALLGTKRVTKKTQLPFGPFLALGAGVTVFFGERVMVMLGIS